MLDRSLLLARYWTLVAGSLILDVSIEDWLLKIATKSILDLEILRNLWYVYCFISFYDLGDALQFCSFDCCEKGVEIARFVFVF